ncbi:hypothetical protein, partial [Nocardia cyriacigeorgica]|uniref:hypothetical protein n=1 Tax=Nocardia cyriacigeorgica TaxID=135487 RepID=UPI0024581CBE
NGAGKTTLLRLLAGVARAPFWPPGGGLRFPACPPPPAPPPPPTPPLGGGRGGGLAPPPPPPPPTADQVVFLDEGRIVEAGTHAELLREGGRYAEFWSMSVGDRAVDASRDRSQVAP